METTTLVHLDAPPHLAPDEDAALSDDRLRALLARPDLAPLLRALHLGDGLARQLPPSALGAWGLDADAFPAGASLHILGASAGLRVLHLVGAPDEATLDALMRASRRHNSAISTLWVTRHDTTLTLSLWTTFDDGSPRRLRCQLDTQHPSELDLERLRAFARLDTASHDRAVWQARIAASLSQERITRRFFSHFVRTRALLAEAMCGGPTLAEERESIALMVLLRLIVLYFLQWRGALDGDRRYLRHRFERAAAHQQDFWQETLAPLCFGALSLPPERRQARARALGALPFLNGGLFEPTTLEREHLDTLSWPLEVWHEVVPRFFELYRFALREPLEEECSGALDPEILGRVFEGLMGHDSRTKTGAYYTPRPLVARLVASTLTGWLVDHTGLDAAILSPLVTHGELDASLSHEAIMALTSRLTTLTLLDPAVGTGAFILEALAALRRCWRGIRAITPDTWHLTYDWPDPDAPCGVRRLLHDNVFGVDLNATAVRLCELRAWLTLLATLPEDLSRHINELEPLPNLGHRLVVGDSLIGPHEVALGAGGPFVGPARLSKIPAPSVSKIATLQKGYMQSHGERKIAAQRALEALEREVVITRLESQRDRHQHLVTELEALTSSHDLFGAPRQLSRADQARLAQSRQAVRRLEERITLARDTHQGMSFSFEARFAQVMARGGFDLVLTNPPWVRATSQELESKGIFTTRYHSARGELWQMAEAHGVRATFGTQPDLAALFLERGLELLRPGGRMSALVPAKLFRSLHGAALRGVLATHDLIQLEDMSEQEQAHFDASVYPAWLEVRKREHAAIHRAPRVERLTTPQPLTRVATWRGAHCEERHVPLGELLLHGRDPREPWLLLPGAASALGEVWRKLGTREVVMLGEREALRPRRGVMTGHNSLYHLEESAALALCGGDRLALETWTRRCIRGRDVRPWQLEPQRSRLLWPYHEGSIELAALEALPEAMRAHLKRGERALRRRSDVCAGEPNYWRLFRVQRELMMPKVVWRDLAAWAEAAPAGCDEVPLNTAYYIGFSDDLRAWVMSAWLNSWVVRLMAWSLAERALGGFRRHFAWTICSLPMPRELADWLSGAPDAALEAEAHSWRSHAEGTHLASLSFCRAYGLPASLDAVARELLQGGAPDHE